MFFLYGLLGYGKLFCVESQKGDQGFFHALDLADVDDPLCLLVLCFSNVDDPLFLLVDHFFKVFFHVFRVRD